jgi:protein-disulfide isomerase
MTDHAPHQPSPLRHALLTALLALTFGFLGAAIWSYSGLADNRTRAFLLGNPDMLPQMVSAYEAQEAEKRLANIDESVFVPFPGAVLGNPQGAKVLVEFTDYNCPYCEKSLEDVTMLVANDPDLKVVIREWPIFEGSDIASRMALAAAMQGKYRVFHEAMFRTGDPQAAARAAGLEMGRAAADAASDPVTVELARNAELARSIGFNGTPAWIVGRTPISGAVGHDALKTALDEADGA